VTLGFAAHRCQRCDEEISQRSDPGHRRLTAPAHSGRELSRTFKTFDHKETDGLEGFVTITGGKATTLRGMAELCADVICRKLDIDEPCRTRETVLLPHTAYYAAAA